MVPLTYIYTNTQMNNFEDTVEFLWVRVRWNLLPKLYKDWPLTVIIKSRGTHERSG